MEAKREIIKETSKVAITLIHDYYQRVQNGDFSEKEGKLRAIKRIKNLRYGPENKDYFWINDYQPKMIMHPYRSDLTGKDLTHYEDLHGKRLFVDAVKIAKKTESGYLGYMWQWKDNPDRVTQKLSYIKGFKPWNWVIGTGIYIEDVNLMIHQTIQQTVYSLVCVILLILSISAYIIKRSIESEQKRISAEKEVRSAEKKLADIIDFLPDPTLVLDKTGHVLAWNKSIEEMTGIKAEAILGKSNYEYALPFYGERRPILCDLVMKNNFDPTNNYFTYDRSTEHVYAESFSPTLGKEGRYLQGTARTLIDESGTLIGAIESIRDITDQKIAKQKLANAHNRLKSVLDFATNLGIIASDLEGIITVFSRGAEVMLGYKETEVIGKATPLLFHDGEEIQQYGLHLSYEYKTRITGFETLITKAKRGLSEEKEWTYIRKDGSKIKVTLSVTPRYNTQGECIGYLGISSDITEKKAAESEVRRLRNLLQNIIDSMPSMLVGIDKGYTVIQWNRTAENRTGIRAIDAIGKKIETVLPYLSLNPELIRNSIKKKKISPEKKIIHMIQGEAHHENITVYPLITNGIEGAVIRIDDISERLQMEEIMIQSEKMLSVGGLAAGMAHEINNPLAGILQGLQVIINRLQIQSPKDQEIAEALALDPEKMKIFIKKRNIPEMIENVMQSGKRASVIVKNMLSFARKSDHAFKPTDPGELMEQTIDLCKNDYHLKSKYDFRRISIKREYQSELKNVICEESKIQQVLLNLLKNGAQAMHKKWNDSPSIKGAPTFIIRIFERDLNTIFEIEDNGPGMPEETAKRIFEPFFTTKHTGVGTGLGLSVSYFIITENHGGEIKVQSEIGRGTIFQITLPQKRSNKHE